MISITYDVEICKVYLIKLGVSMLMLISLSLQGSAFRGGLVHCYHGRLRLCGKRKLND